MLGDPLSAGRAFADLSAWRKVAVSGGDALRWLDDLVTADLSGLAPGRAIRALLLTPTGGVRASFTVAMPGETPLLVQDPAEPGAVDELLAPYVLSSDVVLEDRTGELGLLAFPGVSELPAPPGTRVARPSCLGTGVDVFCPADVLPGIRARLASRFVPVAPDGLEAWRVRAGVPRVGVDVRDGDLPHEVGLEGTVAEGKGCFLGQEAVARARNLGRPRRALLRLAADGPANAGEPVLAGNGEVGTITSAVADEGRTLVLARVRWEAREAPLRTASGVELAPRG